jgi:hypothetical protein
VSDEATGQLFDRLAGPDGLTEHASLALLQGWWAAWQDAERDSAQEVVVLAARRAEVDRLNTACQQLLAARARLRGERLQVEDMKLAVGDRVVCGHNAIAELGVANGSRGTITALNPQARTLTIPWGARSRSGAVTSRYHLTEGYDAPSLARLRRRRLVWSGRSSTWRCAVSLSWSCCAFARRRPTRSRSWCYARSSRCYAASIHGPAYSPPTGRCSRR